MSIKVSNQGSIVYVHIPGDPNSIVWFGSLNVENDHSLFLGETIKVVGVDMA